MTDPWTDGKPDMTALKEHQLRAGKEICKALGLDPRVTTEVMIRVTPANGVVVQARQVHSSSDVAGVIRATTDVVRDLTVVPDEMIDSLAQDRAYGMKGQLAKLRQELMRERARNTRLQMKLNERINDDDPDGRC